MGDREQLGLEVFASQYGIGVDEVRALFAERFGDRFMEEAINAMGGAWPDDELSLRDRSLVVVSALAALGGVDSRLRSHVRWALEHDITADQLEAVASLLAAYVGYPRASVAMEIVRAETGRSPG